MSGGITSQDIDDNVTIQDGAGSGRKAGVSLENRLEVEVGNSQEDFVTIGKFHHEIHEGHAYVASTRFELDIGSHTNDNDKDNEWMIIETGSTKECHFRLEVNTTKQGNIYLYENPTVTKGSEITSTNYNRKSSSVSETKIYESGKPSNKGTFLDVHVQGSKSDGGAVNSEVREFILKQNEQYLIKFVSDEVNNMFNPHLAWYEESI